MGVNHPAFEAMSLLVVFLLFKCPVKASCTAMLTLAWNVV